MVDEVLLHLSLNICERQSFSVSVVIPTYDSERFETLAEVVRTVQRQTLAPAEIVASKFKSGMSPASGVLRTRPLCPFPQTAHFSGTGSTDDAANFVCK